MDQPIAVLLAVIIDPMVYQRDPLSVQFDRQAALTVRLAIEQAEKHKANRRLVPYIRVRVPNPPGALPVRENRPDRLSPHERAFSRALYYDDRIHQLSSRKKPDARWSMKLEWGPVPVLPGQARVVQITLFSDTSGARHVEGNQGKSFVANPELRSGGIGSPAHIGNLG